MRYDFEHYLMAGHGRAYMIAKSDPEKYRDRILEICRDDYSYDMQSEGSRAWLTYDLISLYEDQEPFLAAIKESYSDPSTDTNWERIQYLTDLLLMYDRKVVFAKYKEVEKQIHAEKPLDEIHDLLQSFEYLAISLIQNHGIKVLGSVMRDIGRWFLTRNEEPLDLNACFLWFDSCAEEEFGEDRFEKVREMAVDREAVEEYIRIMSLEPLYRSAKRPEGVRAEEVLEWIHEEPKISRMDMLKRRLMSLSSSEARVLAECLEKEPDQDVKAGIVSVFTSRKYCWPLDITILLQYAESEHPRLREQAHKALALLKDPRIHDLGVKILRDGYSYEALCMVIQCCRKEDEELLMSYLERVEISEESGDWHGFGSLIVSSSDNSELPDSLLLWAYEATLCSNCREGIIEAMLERGIMSDSFKEESKWDANLDIRKMFEVESE